MRDAYIGRRVGNERLETNGFHSQNWNLILERLLKNKTLIWLDFNWKKGINFVLNFKRLIALFSVRILQGKGESLKIWKKNKT